MKTYSKYHCPYCDKRVSSQGLAVASHMRKHIADGLVIKVRAIDKNNEYISTAKGRELLESKGYNF